MSKSADSLQLYCICKYIKWLLHWLTESLENMLLSDSLSTPLTDNYVNLVDGGLLLARLFISFFPSDHDRWLEYATVFVNMSVFVTKLTSHTRRLRVNKRRSDNTIDKRKRTKGQTMIYKTQKTKDRATWTPLKTGSELRLSGRTGSFCTTSGRPSCYSCYKEIMEIIMC